MVVCVDIGGDIPLRSDMTLQESLLRGRGSVRMIGLNFTQENLF